MMPVVMPFDGFVEYGKLVSPTCLVYLERNRYSVPASFANLPVSLRVYPDHFLVVAEGQVICEHQRIIDRSHDSPGHTVYAWRSDARRVGKACVSTCSSRRSPYRSKHNHTKKI